jgi:hypothetical protein
MAGDTSAESWFVRARGRILGPLSWEQLQALRERGQLARFDQVSRDKQSWMPADSLERLFPQSGSGGAFVSTGRTKHPGRVTGRASEREPEPETVGFLIVDDDETVGSGHVSRGGTSGPAADDPAGWYYAEAGAPQGPVAFSDLERLVTDGRIGPGTLYWGAAWISGPRARTFPS